MTLKLTDPPTTPPPMKRLLPALPRQQSLRHRLSLFLPLIFFFYLGYLLGKHRNPTPASIPLHIPPNQLPSPQPLRPPILPPSALSLISTTVSPSSQQQQLQDQSPLRPLLQDPNYSSYLSSFPQNFSITPTKKIPPYLHYVFGLDPTGGFGGKPFGFSQYLSIMIAVRHLHPERVYFWYGKLPDRKVNHGVGLGIDYDGGGGHGMNSINGVAAGGGAGGTVFGDDVGGGGNGLGAAGGGGGNGAGSKIGKGNWWFERLKKDLGVWEPELEDVGLEGLVDDRSDDDDDDDGMDGGGDGVGVVRGDGSGGKDDEGDEEGVQYLQGQVGRKSRSKPKKKEKEVVGSVSGDGKDRDGGSRKPAQVMRGSTAASRRGGKFVGSEEKGKEGEKVRERERKQQGLLRLVKARDVTEIFGRKVVHWAHKADVIRLEALREHGGIYLDTDVFVLKDFKPLLSEAVVMAQEAQPALNPNDPPSGLCNAVILSAPFSSFVSRWLDSFRDFDGGLWAAHSVARPWDLALRNPHEITVLNQYAFFYPLWHEDHMDLVYKSKDYDFDKTEAFAYHAWESLSWPHLSSLDPDRIHSWDEGVENSFTRMARRWVGEELRNDWRSAHERGEV